MNKERKEALRDIVSTLEEAAEEVMGIQCDEEDAFDSLPDSLQDSSRGETMQDWIDFMGDVILDINEITIRIENKLKE